MKTTATYVACVGTLLSLTTAGAQEKSGGDTLKQLAVSPGPAPSIAPRNSAGGTTLPAALSGEISTFAREELALQQQDDPAKLARFYTFPLEDEGQAIAAADFREAWKAHAKASLHRTLETLNVKILTYDAATDTVELQQTYGVEAQPQGHADTERKLIVRQLRIVRAGRSTRAIDRQFTSKEFWTYDARLSAADHYASDRPGHLISPEGAPGSSLRAAVCAIVRQDRINYYSGGEGRDGDDQPCAYFDDAAHRDLLLQARLKLIPDTPETLEAIVHGTPKVRISFSDNLRGENRDGYPILNIGVLDK